MSSASKLVDVVVIFVGFLVLVENGVILILAKNLNRVGNIFSIIVCTLILGRQSCCNN